MAPRDEVRRTPRWSIRRRLTVWFVGSVVGVGIIALPDSGDRVFSLSRTHGPSPVDVLGILVLVAVWVPVVHVLWLRRRAFRGGPGRSVGVCALVGLVGLVATVGLDLGPVYLAPVALLLVVQVIALRVAARRDG